VKKTDDLSLLEGVARGEKSAYSALIDTYQGFIFNIALSVVNDRELAEEVTQDVFLKVFKSVSSFKGDSKLSTWIYRIAYTTSLNEVKKQKIIIDSSDDFEMQFANIECKDNWDLYPGDQDALQRALSNALCQLSQTENLILKLFYIEDLKVHEVSSILGLDKNTVKMKLYRSRMKIRRYLEQNFKNGKRN